MVEQSITLSEGTQTSLARSYELATSFKDSKIGTQHLAMALAEDAQVIEILQRLDVKPQQVIDAIGFILLNPERGLSVMPPLNAEAFTQRAMKCFILAIEEARAKDLTEVTTAHLALGVIREGEGLGAGVLFSLGVTEKRFISAMDKASESPKLIP